MLNITLLIWTCNFITSVMATRKFSQTKYKYKVNRLSSEELNYELVVRGCAVAGTLDERRKVLRASVRLELQGIENQVDYPYTCDEDIAALRLVIDQVGTLMDAFDGNDGSNDHEKIISKFAYAFGRLERFQPESDEAEAIEEKKGLFARLLALTGRMHSLCRSYRKTSRLNSGVPVSISAVGAAVSTDSDSDSIEDHPPCGSSSPKVNLNRANSSFVPVYKWGITFSGKPSESVNSFLQLIEETRQARNVSLSQLFHSASDLFDGKAKVWYRVIRPSLGSWPDLVYQLKEEFQPFDYDEILYEEIKRRTQGEKESIGMYFAIMATMFDRLSVALPESTKLKVIKRNIHPTYQNQLGLIEPADVDELKGLCKKLERNRLTAEQFCPPEGAKRVLERDLAYVSGFNDRRRETENNATRDNRELMSMASNVSKSGAKARNRDGRRCYKCNSEGHLKRDCPENSRNPRDRVYENNRGNSDRSNNRNRHEVGRKPGVECYRCGEIGYTVVTCPICKLKSGNGKANH